MSDFLNIVCRLKRLPLVTWDSTIFSQHIYAKYYVLITGDVTEGKNFFVQLCTKWINKLYSSSDND